MPDNYKPKLSDQKRMESLDGTTLQEVINLAQAKTGWSQERIAGHLHVKHETLRQWKFRGVKSQRHFKILLELTRLAGLSDAQGTVIILRHMIPVDMEHLRDYVGCTVRLYRYGKRPVKKRVAKAAELFKRTVEAIPRAKS